MDEGYLNIFTFFAPCHMATKNLYQYFKRDRQSSLPDNISLSTIDAVNKEVKRIASVQSDDVSKT